MSPKRYGYCLAAILSVLTLILYLPAIRNDFVIWDDEVFVVNNQHIRSLDAAFLRWAVTDLSFTLWQPAAWVSHAIDYAIWGMNPGGHHLSGILLHAINVFLVVCVVTALCEASARTGGREAPGSGHDGRATMVAAGVTGILFGLHPLNVEPAVWISGRTDPICAFFFLLSILTYLRYAAGTAGEGLREANMLMPHVPSGRMRKGRRKLYLLTFAFFVLALTGKPVAVTLPFVLIILDYYPLRRFASGERTAAILLEKLPFVAIGLAVSLVTVIAHRSVGAEASLVDMPIYERFLLAMAALFQYLWKLALPFNLMPLYPFPERVALASPQTLFILALGTGVTVAGAAAYRRHPYIIACWSYFLITLSPSLAAFGGRNSFMADRYTYLPSLGLFILAGLALTGISKGKLWRRRVHIYSVTAVLILVISMAVLTVKQIGIWKDSISLWSHVIERESNRVPIAYNNRGMAFRERGQLAMAIEDYSRSIAIKPDARPYTNRGIAYGEQGKFDLALADFNSASELDPSYADAYTSRGLVYVRTGRLEEAIADFDTAVRLRPEGIDAYLNRGVAFEQMNKFGRAVENYDMAIFLNPSDAMAYRNRGIVLGKIGRLHEASKDLSRAIEINPGDGDAYMDRGTLYQKMGYYELAEKDYQRACELGSQAGCGTVRGFVRQ